MITVFGFLKKEHGKKQIFKNIFQTFQDREEQTKLKLSKPGES